MNIPYVSNGDDWTFYVKGRPIIITTNDLRYTDIVNAVFDGDEETLMDLLLKTKEEIIEEQIAKISTEYIGDLKFVNTEINAGEVTTELFYKGITLPTVLGNKIISLWQRGCTNFDHFIAFIDNLLGNPSERARAELYTFLENARLPITQNGTFMAYKGVGSDLISIRGNTDTTVLKGERLDDGRIRNNINDIIQVRVEDVDPDCNVSCSTGLHVGSYEYARDYGSTILAVEVNPADVISVPTDCNCEKCRVSKYRVLERIDTKLDETEVIVNDDATVDEVEYDESPRSLTDNSRDNSKIDEMLSAANITKTDEAIRRNIESHLITEYPDGTVRCVNADADVDVAVCTWVRGTTISQLCSSVGRKLVLSRAEMLTILLRLGYDVKVSESIGNSVIYA